MNSQIHGEEMETLAESPMKSLATIGLLASIDVEVTGQVRAGEFLRYEVQKSHSLDNLSRFTVRACVEERVVVQGVIVAAQLERSA